MTLSSAHSTARISTRRSRLSLLGLLSVWQQRRSLARLDARALQDIGITKHAADAEARRPFWDAPEIWRN